MLPLVVTMARRLRRLSFSQNLNGRESHFRAFPPISILGEERPQNERVRPNTFRDWPPCPPIQRGGGERSRPGVSPFISALTVSLEQLPDAYSEHYVQVGFWRDYTQGYDKKETFSHAYVNAAGEIYFVDCSIITAYGQIETFDNEHTVYTTVKIGDKEATLGTSEIPGQVTCYILVWEDAGVSCTIMGDGSLDELMKVAESIY